MKAFGLNGHGGRHDGGCGTGRGERWQSLRGVGQFRVDVPRVRTEGPSGGPQLSGAQVRSHNRNFGAAATSQP
jgi:hypothetical protein